MNKSSIYLDWSILLITQMQEIQTLLILHFDFSKYYMHVREVKETAGLFNTVWMLYKSLLV